MIFGHLDELILIIKDQLRNKIIKLFLISYEKENANSASQPNEARPTQGGPRQGSPRALAFKQKSPWTLPKLLRDPNTILPSLRQSHLTPWPLANFLMHVPVAVRAVALRSAAWGGCASHLGPAQAQLTGQTPPATLAPTLCGSAGAA
jgi:hypothetical protein